MSMIYMKKWMVKVRKVVSPIVIFCLVLCIGNVVSAYVLTPWHWPKNGTWSYSIGSSISSGGTYCITVADNQWNGISNKKVTLANSGSTNTATVVRQNGVNEIMKGNYGSNNFLCNTTSWYNSSTHIESEADIQINIDYPFCTSHPCSSTSYSLRGNMTHEMGHVVGLDHSSSTSAVMYAYFAKGQDRISLTQDDKNGYAAISW